MGMHVTEVTFTSHLAPGVASWIRNPGFLAVDPLLKSLLSDEPRKAQVTLQLTNKGWMVVHNGG